LLTVFNVSPNLISLLIVTCDVTTVLYSGTTVLYNGTTVLYNGTTVLYNHTTVLYSGTTVFYKGTTVSLVPAYLFILSVFRGTEKIMKSNCWLRKVCLSDHPCVSLSVCKNCSHTGRIFIQFCISGIPNFF